MDIQSITPAQVTRAYTGKKGCMCGCKGKYYYASAHEFGTVNPAMVTKILRTIQANAETVEVDDGGEWIALDMGNKTWVAYLAK